MKISQTAIQGVMVVDTCPYNDQRGTFSRFFCDRELTSVIGGRRILQINHTRTSIVGSVRGMHFQRSPRAEMKLVRCLKGKVWDVAVDLRSDSPTFLKWHAEELSPENTRMMVIPEGCAHGFQVLAPNSELLYLHSASYTPEAEGGVRHNDPRLAITWPLLVTSISPRDAAHPDIDADFRGVRI